MTDQPSAADTAIHEAGHVVAWYFLGEPFDHVTLEPDERGKRINALAYVSMPALEHPIALDQRPRVNRYVLGMLAGEYVDGRWSMRSGLAAPDREVVSRRAHIDHMEIVRIHRAFLDLSRWRRQLDQLVQLDEDGFWARVEAMADALLVRRRLEGADAGAVLDSAGEPSACGTWRDLLPDSGLVDAAATVIPGSP